MGSRRVADVHRPKRSACPRCGRPMHRVDHEIGGAVLARPCGCAVRYRIDGDLVEVEGDAA